MLEAFFASIILSLGIAASPATAVQVKVPILANRLVLNEIGMPVELIFDPAVHGSGLELVTGQNQSWVPATCVFGSRDTKHEDASIAKMIHVARDKAEAATGRHVAQLSYCRIEPFAVDTFGFKSDEGMVWLPWHSLWGEKRSFRMWYSVNDDTIMLFSFVGDI